MIPRLLRICGFLASPFCSGLSSFRCSWQECCCELPRIPRGEVPRRSEETMERTSAGRRSGTFHERSQAWCRLYSYRTASRWSAGGFLVAVSGLVPIAASSGHWPITEWFLQFAMQRSISTHSLGIEVPPLDDSDLILKGATHYEIACRLMSRQPGPATAPRIPPNMTPHPPDLAERIREAKSQELFYVVKHGVKFTGMPAWPAIQR